MSTEFVDNVISSKLVSLYALDLVLATPNGGLVTPKLLAVY